MLNFLLKTMLFGLDNRRFGAESRYNPELLDFPVKAEDGVVGRMSEL